MINFAKWNIDAEARDEFFQSGKEHVEHIWKEIENGFGITSAPRHALDYGCGVGRVLLALAEKCGTVVGVDISPTMLEETRKNCAVLDVTNVELQDDADFAAAETETYDLVHSYIVLQHIDPKIGNDLIRKMIERLVPGGVGMLHITYFDPSPTGRKLRFRIYRDVPFVHRIMNAVRGKNEPIMPMYEYDLGVIFRMLHENGCGSSFVRLSDHGCLGTMIFFRKEG